MLMLLMMVGSGMSVWGQNVPFTLTETIYNSAKQSGSKDSWNNGLKLDNNGFDWGDKWVILKINRVPDKLSFSYETSVT